MEDTQMTEFNQLLDARKSMKPGRWSDPDLRRILVREVDEYNREERDDYFRSWIIWNKDEDGDLLFDQIYAKKGDRYSIDNKYFMHNPHREGNSKVFFKDCVLMKPLGGFPVYTECSIEVDASQLLLTIQTEPNTWSRVRLIPEV